MSRPASKFSGLLSAVQPVAPGVDPVEDAAAVAASSTGKLSAPGVASSSGGAGASGAGAGGADAATADDGGAVHDRTLRRPTTRARLQPSPPPAAAPRRRGRPAGKRSDPEYDQVTAYIRRQTYRDVRIALLTQGHGQEFSELVEDLLASWLKKGR